jgi:hypothetical protein
LLALGCVYLVLSLPIAANQIADWLPAVPSARLPGSAGRLRAGRDGRRQSPGPRAGQATPPRCPGGLAAGTAAAHRRQGHRAWTAAAAPAGQLRTAGRPTGTAAPTTAAAQPGQAPGQGWPARWPGTGGWLRPRLRAPSWGPHRLRASPASGRGRDPGRWRTLRMSIAPGRGLVHRLGRTRSTPGGSPGCSLLTDGACSDKCELISAKIFGPLNGGSPQSSSNAAHAREY